MQRRQFLSAALAVSGATLVSENLSAQVSQRLHVAVNQYTCGSIYGRESIDFWTRLDELKSTGIDGLEPTINDATEAETIGKRLAEHGLAMRSIYVSANLHEEEPAKRAIARIFLLAEKARAFGTTILVFNPAAKSGKSDAELVCQSKNLDILGSTLKQINVFVAFHYHTTELEFGGREFHHVLCGTDPKNVALCFEQHLSYRASGNSQVAMFDHLKLYSNRIVEVHLRQSVNNVWSETFGDGDIDNARLSAGLKNLPLLNNTPHIVLEQAAEGGTPKTLAPADVFRKSVEYIRRVFG